MSQGLIFFSNIRFQLAAALVMIIITVDYVRNPHLKLMSTRYFRSLLVFTAMSLFFDVVSHYAAMYSSVIPMWTVRMVYEIYMMCSMMVMFFTSLYIIILVRDQKRLNVVQHLLIYIPLLLSPLIILTGEVNITVLPSSAYAGGSMISGIYILQFIYALLAAAVILFRKDALPRYQSVSIQTGFAIWFFGNIIQIVIPTLLLTGLIHVLMLLCIYFSFENQRENFDSETRCFNRGAFHKQMSEYYANKKPLQIINISLENIDRINSINGHDAGKTAMLRIKEEIDRYLGGTVFHSRSSMFTVFLSGETDEEHYYDKLCKLKSAISGIDILGTELVCRISIMDLRKYTSDIDEVYELMDFMRDYCINRPDETVYRLDEEVIAKKLRRDKLDKLVAEAVKSDGFEMVYQPIFSTKEGKFSSAEALVRLKNTGDMGFVSPEEFIPIAEEKGMIMDIGDITLKLAADFAKRHGLEEKLKYIEVNLSGIQAVFPDLNYRLTEICRGEDIKPSFFNLEITETAALDTGGVFNENVNSLRQSGFSFSMDDFGTGYSNLAQMNQMRYDLVKMDKSLIWDAFKPDGENAERLLASVISLLKTINVKIVAEGVETKEMADYLTEKGVDYLQGYYFSKPVNEEKFLEVISMK